MTFEEPRDNENEKQLWALWSSLGGIQDLARRSGLQKVVPYSKKNSRYYFQEKWLTSTRLPMPRNHLAQPRLGVENHLARPRNQENPRTKKKKKYCCGDHVGVLNVFGSGTSGLSTVVDSFYSN